MSIFDCTREEFNKSLCEFHRRIGCKDNTQDEISHGWKCLVLMYLGCQNQSTEEIEDMAMWLKIVLNGAIQRGWDLIPVDLIKQGEQNDT